MHTMFTVHSDTLEQQLFIANNGHNAPELREKQQQQRQPQRAVAGKQAQFTRRVALGDVSNQRGGAPSQHQAQKMPQKPAPPRQVSRASWEAPKKLARALEAPQSGQSAHLAAHSADARQYPEQLHASDAESQAREQVYLREQAQAMEQAQAREQAVARAQQATAWARRQQELQQHHHQQQHQHNQQQQQQQQQQHYMQMQQQQMQMRQPQSHAYQPQQQPIGVHAPTPMRKKKKKRSARRQPVVQGYYPCLSPLVENIIGELPTPARLAYLRYL